MTSKPDDRSLAAAASPPLALRAGGPWTRLRHGAGLQLLLTLLILLAALLLGLAWLALPAALLTVALALRQLLPPLWQLLARHLEDPPTVRLVATLALVLALLSIPLALGWLDPLLAIYRNGDWEAIGAFGEGVIGAVGQILVALVALMIAWRQVMVDQRLTTQQNRITQAQTIDSFIHGISELISDEEGLLEDWPLERMLAEGRLAAVLSSIDADGKARILRFLSHARLLTPLRRDQRLGRAILDGEGSYEEDRLRGVPVIRLQNMLRGADLAGTDLRAIDFNGADLSGADLSGADLAEANLAAVNLVGANLQGALLQGTRFFYGDPLEATPPQPQQPPDHNSGAGTGALVENVNLSGARQLDPDNRAYLAAWSGVRSRQTLPGGCKGLPNRL
ncbi:pentapeptide repeat-containing protein [Synechococcus sp. BA-132 BA5]|uniref:pentapeptide repeat-containing protein n=1 Tax=Synechococcus sp. BA-132 BA5 TaxID=3110252 RepID=UPI002B205BF5|nr:pentapeptide repeat-containing protein [Synechococcus sp. BA-132 BA5]MEA5416579.1 pentapeptide repeat-containing protein [Synechococcus sp. BA-132 BA5]